MRSDESVMVSQERERRLKARDASRLCPCDHDCGTDDVCGKCRCHGDAIERAFGRGDPAMALREKYGPAWLCQRPDLSVLDDTPRNDR